MPEASITQPQGFKAGTAACGIKANGALDVGVLTAERPCTAAAVFTRNRFCGAPIVVGREHVADGRLQAIVVNSGCSNVATGARGRRDARSMCTQTAKGLGTDADLILPSSTGVIGEFLPMDRLKAGVAQALDSCSSSSAAGHDFARAILTTDLVTKEASATFTVGRSRFTVAGCAKGSGMIAPNMATMLSYLTTDAGLPPARLRKLLTDAVDRTFNRITVDECESTSDTVAILANGHQGAIGTGAGLTAFRKALHTVCETLAYKIVQDGEGATRVLEVQVRGARNANDAHRAARAIAVSPLVKTAIHGADPNWGRIIQALGQTDVAFDPDRVIVKLDRTTLFRGGAPARGLDPRQLARSMKRKHITVTVDLRSGQAMDHVLTCDLSREYITINADYHT